MAQDFQFFYPLKTSSLVFKVQNQFIQMYTNTVKDHMYSRSNNDEKRLSLQYNKLLKLVSGRTDFENFLNKY